MLSKRAVWFPAVLLLAVVQLRRLIHQNKVLQRHQGSPALIEASSHAVMENVLRNHHVQKKPTTTTTATATTITTHKLCSNQQITQGRWVPTTLERPPYIPLSPRVRCMRTEDFYKPFSTHIWKPNDDCQFTNWNAPQFIQLLSNQTIVFVGDSLSLEHYASVVHLLGDRARLPPKAVQHKRIKRRICHNVTSSATTSQEEHCVQVVFKTDFPLQNITQELPVSHPTVLVLNRGAHYVPDEELLHDLNDYTLPALHQWNQQCQLLQQQCLLIWRTSVPGHPFCPTFTQPATSVTEMEQWIVQQSTNDSTIYRKGEYHWQDFQHQNQLLVQWLKDQKEQQKWSNIPLQIMDSYQTNILRPDNHRAHMNDCLHSCSPGGGSDLNSQWLLHMLVSAFELSSKEQERG